MARLGVTLRRALRTHRHHRAGRVDRRDRDRDAAHRETHSTPSSFIAFTGVAALWWAYFDFTAVAAERSLHRASPRARGPLARNVFTYFHYPIAPRDHPLRRRGEEDARASLDPLSKAGRWALGLGDRRLPVRVRTHAFPGHSSSRVGAGRGRRGRDRYRGHARRSRCDRDARCRNSDPHPLRRRRVGAAPRGPRRDQSWIAASSRPSDSRRVRVHPGRARERSCELIESYPLAAIRIAAGRPAAPSSRDAMSVLVGCVQSMTRLTAIFIRRASAQSGVEQCTFGLDPSTWGRIASPDRDPASPLWHWRSSSGAAWAGVVAIVLAVLSAVSDFFFEPLGPVLRRILEIALACWVIWAITRPGPSGRVLARPVGRAAPVGAASPGAPEALERRSNERTDRLEHVAALLHEDGRELERAEAATRFPITVGRHGERRVRDRPPRASTPSATTSASLACARAASTSRSTPASQTSSPEPGVQAGR